jgi:hypothetical protein
MANDHTVQCSVCPRWHLDLPLELWPGIMSHLKPKDILSLCSVCGAINSSRGHITYLWLSRHAEPFGQRFPIGRYGS